MLSFTVTRSGNTGIASSANYATSSGTATSGGDFTAASGTVSFAAGETSKTITVSTVNDSLGEPSETLTMMLSNASANTALIASTGTGTINDNDTSMAIGNASVIEGGVLAFPITRSGLTLSAVSASYSSAAGTASSGSDFTAGSGTVSLAVGETSKIIAIGTTDDGTAESAETMTVTLSSPTGGANINVATGTGTIVDDDTYITLADGNFQVLPAHAANYFCSTYTDGQYYWETTCALTDGSPVYVFWFNFSDWSSGEYYWRGYRNPGQLEVSAAYYGKAIP